MDTPTPTEFFKSLKRERLSETLNQDGIAYSQQLASGTPEITHVGYYLISNYPELGHFIRDITRERAANLGWSEEDVTRAQILSIMALGTTCKVAEIDEMPSVD